MTEFAMPPTDQRVAQVKARLTAAQTALLEGKALPLATLIHGACYNGLLGDATTMARWHAQRRRFVFWEHSMEQPKLKVAPHVADAGLGARFAPLFRQETDGNSHISDFAFETTR